jgi:hypothetical protein
MFYLLLRKTTISDSADLFTIKISNLIKKTFPQQNLIKICSREITIHKYKYQKKSDLIEEGALKQAEIEMRSKEDVISQLRKTFN